MEAQPQDEVELDLKQQRVRIRGSDIMGILQLILVCLMALILWKHDADAAEKTQNIVSVLKEQIQIQRENLNAQREANCLSRLDPKNRKESDVEFCRQLGRGH